MSNNISETFGQQLRQMRADVLAQLRQHRGGAIGRAEAAAEAKANESDDWATADAERDLNIALEERESEELVAIDEALKRIDSGSFGVCEACGAEIETARLHAVPTSTRCLSCQERAEKDSGERPRSGY